MTQVRVWTRDELLSALGRPKIRAEAVMNEDDLHLYCADCGAPKADDPSNMPGDDLCGECREKDDRSECEER